MGPLEILREDINALNQSELDQLKKETAILEADFLYGQDELEEDQTALKEKLSRIEGNGKYPSQDGGKSSGSN
jgi:hypothetical protein